MESPQVSEWGPALWMILHSSVERIGSAPLKRLPQEEKRLWTGLLASLRYSLPCPQCKRHYTEYYSKHPILDISVPFLRNWLFQLHCEVNQRTNKENILTIENVSEIYRKPFHFSHHYQIILKHMKHAISLQWCARDDIQRTMRFLEEMRRFYDFF